MNVISTRSPLPQSDEIDPADENPEHPIEDDEGEDEDDEDEDEEDGSQNSDTLEGEEESDGMDDLRNDNVNIYSDEEYVGPPELEVEEQEHFIGESHKAKVLFKIYLQEVDEGFEEWMQTIHVRCSYEGKHIGGGFGRYVRRDTIRPYFWRDMEEPCQELSNIAFDLFDRYGCLREDLKSHVVRKGSGVWGSELDFGSFFVIEDICVEKDWRRKGLGKQVANLLLRKASAGKRNPLFTLVNPGWLTRDIENDIDGKTKKEQQEIRLNALNGANAFFRSLGFRRIGASYCFGLATDPDHQAHALPSGADFDPLSEETDTDEPPEGYERTYEDIFGDPARSSWRLKLLEERLPLHYAAIILPDNECVEFFKEFKLSEKQIEDWVKVDRFSKNILHIAASETKAQSVRWLLGNVDDEQKLSSARDIQGYTPLEGLESELETKRNTTKRGTMTFVISDKFRGHSAEAIECLAALRKVANLSTPQYLRLKYGCSCGECIDGFLSPCMKLALLSKAEVLHDILNDGIEDGKFWYLSNEYLTDHVAPDIQQNFRTNKSLRQGYSNIFDHVAMTLRANMAPTVVNVLNAWRSSNEWPPVTRNFYQRGGNAESTLRVIFEHAKDADEYTGDGNHMRTFEDDINDLPKCRNDHEFGFVALACGVGDLPTGEVCIF